MRRITCALLVVSLGMVALPLRAADWIKESNDRYKRAALHGSMQQVRSDSGKWGHEFRLQHAPPIEQKPAQLSLDAWADQLQKSKVALTDKDDHWLILRPEQLDDNDRVWIERIERRGQQITVVANQAKWQGKYFRNFTYYPAIGLNLGKLEPGQYEVKCIMQPLVFTRFDGDGKALDTNWPMDERLADKKPAEARLTFTVSAAPDGKRTFPYAEPAHERQVLDIYAPPNAKNLPVVFWIHGGGWQTGDKSSVQLKPQFFMDRGFVFVSTNYRLLPSVDMATIVRDIAKSIHWVHDHIAAHGGDPKRLLIMGHSAGAQLAALVCTDERYLKAEGLSLAIIKGCVPVDGDTYDIPAMIETAETRNRVHGLPQPKFGHRVKFGDDPAKHKDFSAVTHVATGKGIPPFLILHVADHPDVRAQAQRLDSVLKEAGIPVTNFGARETNHTKINADLGLPEDPSTKALLEFLGKALKN